METKRSGNIFVKAFVRSMLVVLFIALYLITSVPVGLFLYSMKSDLGINVFSKTGFHAYMHCLRQEAYKIKLHDVQEKRKLEHSTQGDDGGNAGDEL